MMSLEVSECELHLAQPFRFGSITLTTAQTVVAQLHWNNHIAYGESAPFSRYGDSVAAIMAFFASFALPVGAGPFSAARTLAHIPRAARCALDIAMFDLRGKALEVSVSDLLGLEGLERHATSLSVWLEDDINAVMSRVRTLRNAPILKVKVGGAGSDDVALIEAIRSAYTGTIRIDVNEGWEPQQALTILQELNRFDIEFCEQPILAGNPAELRWLSERSPIPIVADEDAVEAAHLPQLYGSVYGVNVKLAKCGGIAAAYDMIVAARALGLKIMIGCMVESSILATAAAHLAPLADWLDIDGPTLLVNDPFTGVHIDGGHLAMPKGPGLGVRLRSGNEWMTRTRWGVGGDVLLDA